MNPSFAILQKIRRQLLPAAADQAAYQVAFAPFAFTLSSRDFAFLKGTPADPQQALQALQDSAEFACLANALPREPWLWRLDGEQGLDGVWRQLLADARLVDADAFSADEQARLDQARALLYLPDGSDSPRLQAYKRCAQQVLQADQALIAHQALQATLPAGDAAARQAWARTLQALTEQRRDLDVAWLATGYKSQVESARALFEQLVGRRQQFIARWAEARTVRTAAPSLLTDAMGQEFLLTAALPNAIADAGAPIWHTLTLEKAEIAQLASAFAAEVPAAALAEFGDVAPELERIRFDWCALEIQRPWFDEQLLTSRWWTLPEGRAPLSTGTGAAGGVLGAYPVKLILARQIEMSFAPQSAVNDSIRERLKAGLRLLCGPLLLKTMPINLPEAQARALRVQALSPLELRTLAAVATPAAPGAANPPAGGVQPRTGAPAALNPQGRLQALQQLQRPGAVPLQRRMALAAAPMATPAAAALAPQRGVTAAVANAAVATAVPAPVGAPGGAAAPGAGARAVALGHGAAVSAMALPVRNTGLGAAGLSAGKPPPFLPMPPKPMPMPMPLPMPMPGGVPMQRPPVFTGPAPAPAPAPTPAPAPAPAATPATVRGRVVDAANQPVAVAEVQLLRVADGTSQSVLSGDDGRYSLPPQPPGAYQLRACKSGFELLERALTLSGDSVQDLLLQAQPVPVETFQVIGVVCRRLPRLPDPQPGLRFV